MPSILAQTPQLALRSPSSTPSLAPSTSTLSVATTLPSTSERNVDHVILGALRFKAWYPSMYPKEIIGREVTERKGDMLENLYICRWCFGYARDVKEYLAHGDWCELKGKIPGRRIYSHPEGKRGREEGESAHWAVWEIDGEVDTTFCQNLSLFAKLFLDNKSVFFDVPNFNYYLLVHTPIPSSSSSSSPAHNDMTSDTPQVIGFFSKEKMSWDNNNLACILIFPPWQRKSLGNLLIAVSYEISRRERILGGPEKPISDLGKRGYLTYWGREISRWLMELKDKPRKLTGKGGITLLREVSVNDISESTWIAQEDVLFALREMGVVVRIGDEGKVSIDREALRCWVVEMGLTLEPVIDSDGFIEGYGYKEVEAKVEESEGE